MNLTFRYLGRGSTAAEVILIHFMSKIASQFGLVDLKHIEAGHALVDARHTRGVVA